MVPLIPIRQLLSRIRWDPEFGKAEFRIGYRDRHERALVWVEHRQLRFPVDGPETFEVCDETGRLRRIPFHRVREVVRDGKRIWQRPSAR